MVPVLRMEGEKEGEGEKGVRERKRQGFYHRRPTYPHLALGLVRTSFLLFSPCHYKLLFRNQKFSEKIQKNVLF